MEGLGRVSRQALSFVSVLLLLMYPGAGLVMAQDNEQSAPPPQSSAPPQQQLLSPDQLATLVAPIALYPDALLSQVLVASTYPLEVVEADQWLRENGNLQGQQLVDAARQQNWDPSVQALVVFPDVIHRLNSDIRWTTDLGNAFLAQQADVMAAVQRLRSEAMASGRLRSTPQETVTTETQDGQNAIAIQPTDPQVIYVPTYNPEYVWGPPLYGYYPPLWYPSIGFGFGFGPGIYCGGFFAGLGWGGWGWGPNWFLGSVFLNGFFFNHYGFRGFDHDHWRNGFGGREAWSHNPNHRMGVPYANRAVANRFGGNFGTRSGNVARSQSNGGQFTRSQSNGSQFNGRTGSSPVRSNGWQNAAPRGTTNGGWSHLGNSGSQPGTRSGSALGNTRSGQMSPGRAYGSTPGTGSNSYRAPSYNAAPSYRSAPSYQSAPSYRSAPSYSYRAGPSSTYRGSYGGVRNMPAYRSAPSFNGGGSYRSAPSFHSSPRSFSGGGSSFHGGGGGGSFHGGGGSFHGGGGSSHGGGGGGGRRR